MFTWNKFYWTELKIMKERKKKKRIVGIQLIDGFVIFLIGQYCSPRTEKCQAWKSLLGSGFQLKFLGQLALNTLPRIDLENNYFGNLKKKCFKTQQTLWYTEGRENCDVTTL